MSELDLPDWTATGGRYQKDYNWYLRMVANDEGYWAVLVAFGDGARVMGEGKAGGRHSFEGHLKAAQKAAGKWAKDFVKKNGKNWEKK